MKKSLKEIEVKAKIDNFNDVIKKLVALGCILSEPIVQEDTVYFFKGITVADVIPGTNTLRIRKEKGKIIFNLKQSQEVSLSNIEKELEIQNASIMDDIIKLLGFYEFQKIKKTRRKTRYKNYEICLDVIDQLGNFIEVEKMTDEDSAIVQEELFRFLESLGVSKRDRADRGYDILLYKKLHNIIS